MSETISVLDAAPLPARADSFRIDGTTWLLLTVLAVFVAVAFAPAVRASFVDLDDEVYVFRNPNVLNGLSLHSVKWALTTRAGGIYIPVTWLSLQLDATISGMLNPDETGKPVPVDELPDATIYHVTNIVLQTLSAWLLFLFLYRATKNRWASFAAVLLWAVHPLRVESVAWVTERKDVIAGVFGFLAMYLYLISVERKSRIWFWVSCTSLTLSLWGKAMFVMMPLLLLLVDYWPMGRIRSVGDVRRATVEKWPMWVIVIVAGLGTAYTARGNGTLMVSQWEKMENAFLSYGRCLGMQVDFRSLAAFYPYVSSSGLWASAAVAAMAAITGAVIWQRKRYPWLMAGWLWYLIAFVPTIGFMQCYVQAYADRYSYLPSVGLAVMLVFSAFQWRQGTALAFAGVFVVATILTAFTYRQSMYWQNSVTLFERAREVTPPSALLYAGLGNGYMRAGRLEEARQSYLKVIEHDPRSWAGHLGLASVYQRMGRPELRLIEAKILTDMEPGQYQIRLWYGAALLDCGRTAEAVEQLEIALKILPNDQRAQDLLWKARKSAAPPQR